MDKSELRRQLKLKRRQLSQQEIRALSQKITTSCLELIDWTNVKTIHTYLPIKDQNEINTHPLLKTAWMQNSQIRIASSDLNGETCWLDSGFKPTKKIPKVFQYDLIIVPMLGFDKSGYRLGYGGGFYDKFLANQHRTKIIGVCYEFGNLPELPHEEHDIPLQIIITEKSIYKF